MSLKFYLREESAITSANRKTQSIANVRMHVERVIRGVSQRYSIMSATGILPKDFLTERGREVC